GRGSARWWARGAVLSPADLSAAHCVRFVRSSVAAGRIVRISAPAAITLIRAAALAAPPIKPVLHKYNYRPIEQPILADEVVRFVGEPIAAVVAPTPAEAEDAADRVEIEIADVPAVTSAHAAVQPDAAAVHAAGHPIVHGQFQTPPLD